MAEPAVQDMQVSAGPVPELVQALRRLSVSPEDIRARALRAAEGREALAEVLLQEIDETVLPRELTISAGGARVAVLTVAHRRLAGVALHGKPDSASEADDPQMAAALFAGRLQRLQTEMPSGGFTILRRSCKGPAGAGSCTAQMLRDALSAVPEDSRLDRFRAAVQAHARAWIFGPAAGGAAQTGGAEEVLMQLGAARAALAAGLQRTRRPPAFQPKPECIVLPLSPGARVIAATDAGRFLLLACSASEAGDLLGKWQQVYSPQAAMKLPAGKTVVRGS